MSSSLNAFTLRPEPNHYQVILPAKDISDNIKNRRGNPTLEKGKTETKKVEKIGKQDEKKG